MGPRAGKAHVEVQGRWVSAGILRIAEPEFGGGPSVTAGGIGGGQLRHHDLPRRVPCCTDGGDEETRWEGWTPK